MRIGVRWWLVVALVVGLTGGCAAAKKDDGLRARIFHYAAAIRWNEFEQAVKYIDPAWLAEHPFTDSDAERWRQVQVARYFEGPQSVDPEGRVVQTVQIELIDRATQSVRSIVDRQRWRFDPAAGIWWLETGLPDLNQKAP